MSYLIYNNKRVYSKGNENKYVTGELTPGQIYFSTPGSVEFSSYPDLTGNKTLKFGMRLDALSSTLNIRFTDPDSMSDTLCVEFHDVDQIDLDSAGKTPVFRVQTRNAPPLSYARFYDIDSYIGMNVEVEIIKTTSAITSVKFNNTTLTELYGGGSVFGYTPGASAISGAYSSIWDVEIVGLHKWIGYPYGNTTAAWEDTIGNLDGTITGSPSTRKLF